MDAGKFWFVMMAIIIVVFAAGLFLGYDAAKTTTEIHAPNKGE